jgi:predicted site-specific integrase-resolvase
MKTHSGLTGASMSLTQWRNQKGISKGTAYRWGLKGWIHPINIYGRLYITAEDAEQFERRARAGEFAVDSKPPPKRRLRRAA